MPSTGHRPREYGPHDPIYHEARTVKATKGSQTRNGRPGKYGPFVAAEVPIPRAILKQLAAINDAAYRAGQAARRQAENEAGQ